MAICLIGTKPGEVKAFRRDYENDEWKNLAEDQRNSQVQVLNDNSLLFFRVIPDDKSKELRIPVPNGIIIDSTSGRGCIQLGIGKDLFLLKFKTTEEAEEFKTRAEALKELRPLPPPVVTAPQVMPGNPTMNLGRPLNFMPPEPAEREAPRVPLRPMPGVPQPDNPGAQYQPEQPRAKVPTADNKQKFINPSAMKLLLINNPVDIARQLTLALNQGNVEKALLCIDSIGALKKQDVKFQISYKVEETAKLPINITINIEFQSQKKSLKVFLEVDENHTFSAMQLMIEERYHIPCAAQKWIVGDKLVSNDSLDKKLVDYGITNAIEEVTLYMYVLSLNKPNQPRGGGGPVSMQPPASYQPRPLYNQGARVPYGYQNYPQPSDWSSREPMNQYGRPAQPSREPMDQYGRQAQPSREPMDQYGRQAQPSREPMDQYGRPAQPSREPMDQYGRQAQPYGYNDRESFDGHYQPYDMRGRGPMTPGEGYPKRGVGGYRPGPEVMEQPFQQQRDMRAQRPGPEEMYPRMNPGGMPYVPREY